MFRVKETVMSVCKTEQELCDTQAPRGTLLNNDTKMQAQGSDVCPDCLFFSPLFSHPCLFILRTDCFLCGVLCGSHSGKRSLILEHAETLKHNAVTLASLHASRNDTIN